MDTFMIGCNYWDSKSGTDMWKNWDEAAVREDLAALAKCGVKYLRVFPLWRDFQPVRKLYGWANTTGEYALGEEEACLDDNPCGLDYEMVKRFRTFAEIAKSFDMKLMVSIVTGWMSGRMFVPPAIEGKNLIADPEALMWTERFIRGLVTEIRDLDNIVMWDLGNECNCMCRPSQINRAQAYTWTAFVRNAICSADPTRPISSGMHGLDAEPAAVWHIADQGELCDMVTTHPYPSPTIKNDIEPYNRIRGVMVPTAQSEYYSGISGKPCMIQESGTFSPAVGNEEMSADFMRANLLSAWANNLTGYLWWCGMEHLTQLKAPYSWSMMERQLGMVYLNKTPKPVGREMARIQQVLAKLPVPGPKDIDAVCVLPRGEKLVTAEGAYVLAKQAGLNIKIVNCETTIPEADAYIMPCCSGWQVTYRRTWDFLLERVHNHGAKLLVTNNGGHFTQFEEVFGIRSWGMSNGSAHTAKFDFGEIRYQNTKELKLESIGAEILATNEEGNPIFFRNRFGKGDIYFLDFGVEQYACSFVDGLDPERNQPLYRIYKQFAGDLTDRHVVTTENPFIGLTQSRNEDGSYLVTAINYSDKDRAPQLEIKPGWQAEVLYGGVETIGKCDAAILHVSKELG